MGGYAELPLQGFFILSKKYFSILIFKNNNIKLYLPSPTAMFPTAYFSTLPPKKMVLWCYLIWYLSTVIFHFDSSPSLWINSLGISAVIGCALLLSVNGSKDPWQTFRLFLMPFCVSSFSSLIKGQGYFLIFPRSGIELFMAIGASLLFVLWVLLLQKKIWWSGAN